LCHPLGTIYILQLLNDCLFTPICLRGAPFLHRLREVIAFWFTLALPHFLHPLTPPHTSVYSRSAPSLAPSYPPTHSFTFSSFLFQGGWCYVLCVSFWKCEVAVLLQTFEFTAFFATRNDGVCMCTFGAVPRSIACIY